ncbi:beta-ketoacyl-[acyl-carrier-protein] synthase family protein [soil metagenome]
MTSSPMPAVERRVVITGLGLVSPLGIGPERFWSALAEGQSGVGPIQAFDVGDRAPNAGGEVRDFNPKALAIDKHRKALGKNLKYMARDIQLAVAAAELAVVDGGLVEGGIDPTRIGIGLGAGLISTDLDELADAINIATRADGSFDFETYGRDGIPVIDPLWLLKYLPNMLACHIGILNDCQGPSNTITEAEAASNLAIGEACRIIQRGKADVMVSGGADSKIHPLSLVRLRLLNNLSQWRGDPSQAVKPFDRRRDGWVPGEGAGILILEDREHAQRRHARIYGEILGFGSGCDAHPGGGLDPDGIGTEIAMRAALRDAGLAPEEIGHVNAHGAATVVSDLAEARAIGRVFGEGGRTVPVTALKGYMGNLASGCGSVELIASLLGVRHGLIPSILNCDEPDPACEPLDLVREQPRPTDNPTFLTTNLTRHGQAAALVVRGYPNG